MKLLALEGMNLKQVEAHALMPLIHDWQHLSQTPESELLTVFGPYLKEQSNHTDPVICQQAAHMMGWLKEEPLQSAMFMLDRIPEKSRTSPPSRLSEPLMDFVVQAFEQDPGKASLHLMPRLLNVNPGREYTSPLLKTLIKRKISINPLFDKVLDVLRYNSEFSPVRTELALGGSSFDNILSETAPQRNDLITLNELIGSGNTNIPPLLRSVLGKRSNTLTVDFNKLKTSWSPNRESLLFEYGQMKMTISKNQVKTDFINPTTHQRNIQIAWDSRLFIWGVVNETNGCLSAKLYQATTPAQQWNDPLLDLPRSLCLSKWGDTHFSENSLHGECQFNLDGLENAQDLSSLIKSIQSGLLMELSPDEAIHLELMFDDQKPTACMARNQKSGAQAFLELKFSEASGDANDPLEKAYGVKPNTNSIQSNYVLTPWPAPPEQVKISSAWNRAENRLENFTAIHSVGENAYVWLGNARNHVHLLSGGEYRYAKDPNPMILLAKGGENDYFPIEVLTLLTNFKYTSTRGSYDFQPSVHCSTTRWPEEGFEGFVNEIDCGDYKFSGYITSNGQAIGRLLVATPRLANGLSDILAGSFKIDRHFVPNQVASQHSTLGQDQVITLPDGRCLRPHGFCQYYGVNSDNMDSIPRSRVVFFNGYGFLADSVARVPSRPYDAPNSTQHFKGVQFDHKNKSHQIDIVINPKDGSSDFLWVRPAQYSIENPYQALYTDMSGFEATLLMINERPTIGTLNFPNGLVFKGKLEQTDEEYYGPKGQGSVTFKDYGLSGQFNHAGVVTDISAKNAETDELLGQLNDLNQGNITMTTLIDHLAGGEINYTSDLQGKMRIRDLPDTKPQEIQHFNRMPGSRTNQLPLRISPAIASQTTSH
ncbi:hypothetical protein [Limnobacter sp.]|uniref:hypothetical protein n=1 Tax=Limnobacter sp. TaxID=2003368 RepID=UPI002E37014C|nr:hypothetical protein [Limnobacter sp.]